jgi:hypothetical protein
MSSSNHSTAQLLATVSSSVSSPNVNIVNFGGSVDEGAGNSSAGTLRVVVATDDVNSAAIKVATELIDDAVFVDDADWTDTTSKHMNVGGVYQSVPQTVTDGDVAPLSLNINGATRITTAGGVLTIPNVDSYTHLAINLAAAADQVLVSSAANKQIWVYAVGFVVNAAGTVSFQDEDNVAITGVMPFAANSGLGIPPSGNFAMPIWKLGTDKDLEVDIVTSELDGFLDYAIVSV